MDSQGFDRITRRWASSTPRRTLLGALIAGAIGRASSPQATAKKQKKKKRQKNQKYSVNEEGSLPDPLYPRQGMSTLSRTTQDIQLGGAAPKMEEQSMQVSGVVQDEGAAPGVDF